MKWVGVGSCWCCGGGGCGVGVFQRSNSSIVSITTLDMSKKEESAMRSIRTSMAENVTCKIVVSWRMV